MTCSRDAAALWPNTMEYSELLSCQTTLPGNPTEIGMGYSSILPADNSSLTPGTATYPSRLPCNLASLPRCTNQCSLGHSALSQNLTLYPSNSYSQQHTQTTTTTFLPLATAHELLSRSLCLGESNMWDERDYSRVNLVEPQQKEPVISNPSAAELHPSALSSSSPCSSSAGSRPESPISPPMPTFEKKIQYAKKSKDGMHENVNDDSFWSKVHKKSMATTRLRAPRGRCAPKASAQGRRTFICQADGCGKLFKRSEHLKRHIRSIHTLDKPFACPYQTCGKRFSRSDNLNQHIRIHRRNNVTVKRVPPHKPTDVTDPCH